MGVEQIQSGLQTILAFLVVLGITITIHEFGHFAVAKLLKIRVVVFSLGFGPRLLGFTRGGTEYRISAFPLGGYVKMAGETFDEDRQGSPDEFLSHPKWHRFLVAIAGPFMNIALAVAILTTSYMDGIRVPRFLKEPPLVGPVVDNTPARRAGLRTGDRILSVGGNPVDTWEDMEIGLATAPKDSLDLEVARNQERLRIHLDPGNLTNVDAAALGFKFSLPRTIVAGVDPKSPAHQAGLKEGDEILKVQGGGKTGRNYDEILNIISESKGVPLDFEVRRGGEIHQVSITPAESDGRVLIGFVPEVPSDLEKYGVGRALTSSIRKNYEMSILTFKIIGRIFTGSASVKNLSGPLEIARISGNAARTGSARVFFGFIALVSLQLGVFNLLPIPILDGGVIALLLVEGIIRRDLSLAIKEKIIQVGFVFLILLMGFAVFNDLSKSSIFDRWFR
jgi:regulator of sigma E protease